MASRAGQAPQAHIAMLLGDQLLDVSAIRARTHYEEALATWKRLGYRKGVHDLALRDAIAINRVDGPSREAIRYAHLAQRTGEAMGLPTARDARRLIRTYARL